MPNLFVSYDLHQPNKDYPKITAAIQQLGTASSRVLLSLWYLKTNLSGPEVRDRLAAATDTDDKYLVIEAKDAWGSPSIAGDAWQTVADNWKK